jgi:protein O-mannosyl-transferase
MTKPGRKQKASDCNKINSKKASEPNTRLYLLISFCIPVLVYLQTLHFGFTNFDDNSIILNNISFFQKLHNIPNAFQTDAFIIGSGYFYRPLQTVTFIFDCMISGIKDPWAFHFTNILLLGLISISIYKLLLRFSIAPNMALLSTLIYCVHPLFNSSVSWIPGRGDLLLTLFSLLSLLLLIGYIKHNQVIYVISHWLTFVLALFCKETAAALPLLFFLYLLLIAKEKIFSARVILLIFSYSISILLWFWIRSNAINSDLEPGVQAAIGSIVFNLRIIPESVFSFQIPFDIAPVPAYSVIRTIGGCLFIAAGSVLFIRNYRSNRKEQLFCLLWFIGLLLPTMLYKDDKLDYLNHRFFLPMFGFMLFILITIPENISMQKDLRKLWWMIAVLILLSGYTFASSLAYSRPLDFYNAAISHNQRSAFLYNNRGNLKSSTGNIEGAVEDFTASIDLKPDYIYAYLNRGNEYYRSGSFENAIKDYTRAIEIQNDASAYYNRGSCYYSIGSYDQAIVDFTKALDLKPESGTYDNRATAYFAEKNYRQAEKDYSSAIKLNPEDTLAYNMEGTCNFALGLYSKACEDFNKAAQLGSSNGKKNATIFCNK